MELTAASDGCESSVMAKKDTRAEKDKKASGDPPMDFMDQGNANENEQNEEDDSTLEEGEIVEEEEENNMEEKKISDEKEEMFVMEMTEAELKQRRSELETQIEDLSLIHI